MLRNPMTALQLACRFLRHESGAATVDWVVLCGAATATAVAAMNVGNTTLTDYSGNVRDEVQSPYFVTDWTDDVIIPPFEEWDDPRPPIVPAYEDPDGGGDLGGTFDPTGNASANGDGAGDDTETTGDDDTTSTTDPGTGGDTTTGGDASTGGTTTTTGGSSGGSSTCPNGTLTGTAVSATGSQLWNILTYSNYQAGGDVALTSCSSLPGRGYVDTQPNISLTVSQMSGYNRLEIETYGSCDTVLLARDPSGNWYFDDDSGRNYNAELNIPNNPVLSGRVDIWVGTFAGNNCSVTLEIENW